MKSIKLGKLIGNLDQERKLTRSVLLVRIVPSQS